ncbi:hypothetical protein AMK59_3177 [Oryctes borbonicus]|uniref:Tc1-like transposase DDE domain-containing protein n=1 Tax=Oryctes borbonicus TaxID=1629725 RepID=A0A0T6B3R8_9SCAR|nr:hypothetical protein AMK59_3177 [Oryctes borbonicus]
MDSCNSTVHTSRAVYLWFDNPETELLRCPSKLPNLNPIENLCGMMATMWGQEGIPGPRNRDKLRNHVSRVWYNLCGRATCKNLVVSMPGRFQEVITNNGYWTSY